jgi:hypothetical protein
MLAANSGITNAITSDTEIQPDAVIAMLIIRDKITCGLRIPKDRYDGLAILQMIEEHTGKTNANA